jgi:hypothetical protein
VSSWCHGEVRSVSYPFPLAAFYPQTDTFSGWTRGDLNPWPPPCEGGALPTELRAHNASKILAVDARIARVKVPDEGCSDGGP